MSALRHLVTRLWAWWTQPRAHARIDHDWQLLETGWRAAQHAAHAVDAQQERARRREQAARALRYRHAQRTLLALRREVDLLQRRQRRPTND